MAKSSILLFSSSRVHGCGFLQFARLEIDRLLAARGAKVVLFVPYAQRDHDAYTATVAEALTPWGYQVEGLHRKPDPVKAVRDAQAIFIGGGNTFVLLKALYELKLVDVIREQVRERGLPYIGSSAGTNVATRSIHTTNDMPVAYPPTFEGLRLLPFNINPHYIEADPESKHKGETRDERLAEFVQYHQRPVLGLREGSSLLVEDDRITLLGNRPARLFRFNQPPCEYEPNSDLGFLIPQSLL